MAISHLVALCLTGFAVASSAFAQTASTTVRGIVRDSAGASLRGVRVVLVPLGRLHVTDTAGKFRFTAVAPGTYTIVFSRLGLRPETQRLVVHDDTALSVILRSSGLQLPAMQVTATTGVTGALASPQPISVLEGAELRTAQSSALGDVLEAVPGVRSLSMSTGIGKPVIRGMTHYRIVVLDNGQRSETQSWGHDHSPNVETASADRIEVIKGPSSVLYGSDALGGVVNVIAPAIVDALDQRPFVRSRYTGSYNDNIRGAEGTLTTEAAAGGAGVRGSLTLRSAGDMRTPAGALRNTDHDALAGELAAGVRGSWGDLQARFVGRDERIEIFDDPIQSPGYSGFQRIATRRAVIETQQAVRGARLQWNAGYEENFRREFADEAAASPDLGLYVANWTGFAHLHHAPVGFLRGTVGVSAMTSEFENRGTETLIPNSATRNAAVYAFEQAELGRWTAMVGARYDARALHTEGDTTIIVPAQRRSFGAATGSVGLLYRIAPSVALALNVARGFRAPAAPDLWANGFHEGTRGFERGDPTLGVETSLNTDVGIRVAAEKLTVDATTFRNRVQGYIYLRPFGSGAGAFDSLQVVQGDARLQGVEASMAYRAHDLVTLQLSGDYVRGDNLSAAVPLTFIPPARVIAGVRVEAPASGQKATRPYLSTTLELNGAQRRVDPRDLPTAGYTIAGLGGGFTRLASRGPFSIDLSARNIFGTRYRSFMSRYKEFALGPGRALVLRVSGGI